MICILEASGKWPEETDAVKRLKAAFHIKLGEILEKKYKLTNSASPTHVDVLKVKGSLWFPLGLEKWKSIFQSGNFAKT